MNLMATKVAKNTDFIIAVFTNQIYTVRVRSKFFSNNNSRMMNGMALKYNNNW